MKTNKDYAYNYGQLKVASEILAIQVERFLKNKAESVEDYVYAELLSRQAQEVKELIARHEKPSV